MARAEIEVIATPYKDVIALLKSETLRAVEDEIAARTGENVLRDYSTASTTYTQAAMSVSGMSPSQIESFLLAHREEIVDFGLRFHEDEEATKDEEEYPDGEEQDDDSGESISLGLGTGFGIIYAIYYNFLANRSMAEFRAFLKNRRIPKHAKFARELKRVFDETDSQQR